MQGEVAEWLKAHDSKSCGLKGLGGSNPLASAIKIKKAFRSFFIFICERMRTVGWIIK